MGKETEEGPASKEQMKSEDYEMDYSLLKTLTDLMVVMLLGYYKQYSCWNFHIWKMLRVKLSDEMSSLILIKKESSSVLFKLYIGCP